jgi:hypothetical protein
MSNVAFFEAITFHSDPSGGSVAQLDVFRDLTRTRLAPDPQIIEKWLGHQDALLERKEALLQWDLVLYRATTPWLAGVALLAFGVTVVSAVCDRRLGGSLLAAGAFLVGVVSRVAVVAIVDSTSFPSVNASYLSPSYALVVGFVALTCHAVVEAAGVRTARGRTP